MATAPAPAYLAPALDATPRNLLSAVEAFARLTADAWQPIDGYPGSDTHWLVRCLVCDDWQGSRFYSHLRRGKPLFRHKGCLPVEQHQPCKDELLKLTASACTCTVSHPTTAEAVATVMAEIAAVRQADNGPGVLPHLARLLGPCPAFAVRAAAAREFQDGAT